MSAPQLRAYLEAHWAPRMSLVPRPILTTILAQLDHWEGTRKRVALREGVLWECPPDRYELLRREAEGRGGLIWADPGRGRLFLTPETHLALKGGLRGDPRGDTNR